MRYRAIVLLGLAVVTAALPASAQSRLEANVPFEFQVGKKTMPAGMYDVETDLVSGIVSLRGRSNRRTAMTTSFAAGGGERTARESKLVFNRYGDSYFLSQIWRSSSTTGRQLPVSRFETDIAEAIPRGPVNVMVAVK